ncbi:MAG: phosphoglycolate phosphatase [Bryobacterales bacterium]|nr:phosphoglycolate phosphatase [Bryobacterales bacterium]
MPLLIFDLDGTLIDSRLDLAHAVNATREHMGKPPLSHELIFSYVGNGAPVLVQRAMGADASVEEVQAALEFFLAYYRQHSLDYTVLYPGVRESIEQLSAAGIMLAVLTNKPVGITRLIMDHLDLSGRMFRIYGGNSFDQKKPHPVGIDTLRTEAGATQADTWMIGDSWVDIQTARNAGVPSCGVTYGFQPESLVEYPPDVLVDRLEDFAQRFLPERVG